MTPRQPIPFGKYLLLDRVNIGGMAEVWKAKTFGAEGFEKIVAIKRILPSIAEDEEFIAMFIDEAKISVQLTHANVAQVFDLGKIGDSYYIAMEYVSGKDLRAVFDKARKRGEPAPIPLTCYVLAKAAEGLDYAHRKRDAAGGELNIVHRDVSPQNILCSFDGEVKVIDFGIAKAANKATKTQAGILKGKFGYMSPEQVRGLPLDRRSDVFALGVVLYELLTGERLFVGDSDFSVLEKVRAVDVLPPSTYNQRIPPALEKIVLRALAKDVEERFSYASDLGSELQRFLITATSTNDSIFSRQDLMQFMKSTFAEEVEREKIRLQEYAEIHLPPGMAVAAGAPPSERTVVGFDDRTSPETPNAAKRGLVPAGLGGAPAVVNSPAVAGPGASRVAAGTLGRSGMPAGRVPTSPGLPAIALGRPSNPNLPAAPALAGPGARPPLPRPPPVARPSARAAGLPFDEPDDALAGTARPPRRMAQSPRAGQRSSGLAAVLAVAVALLGGGGTAAYFLLFKQVGTLLVNTTPAEAIVILDGQLVAQKTPYFAAKLSVGKHHLEVAAQGYGIYQADIAIARDQTNSREIVLKKLRDPEVQAPGVTEPAAARIAGGGK